MVGDIVNGTYDGSNDSVYSVMDSLKRYSDLIDGWARTTASKMFDAVNAKDMAMWRSNSQEISVGLRQIMENTAIGQVARNIVEEQIKLIKSLPLQAADRVQDIHNQALEAVITGGRAGPFAKEIAKSGDVAISRANMIARTEIGRASTALTQARSLSIGSSGYIWRTAEDSDVRHSHQKMEGKFVRWDNPPTLDGMTGHAGALPNCRCYCEVIIPDNG